MITFIIGFFIGGVFGCVMMSALIAAGEADRQDEKIRRMRQMPKGNDKDSFFRKGEEK